MMIVPFGTAPDGGPVSLIQLDNGILSCQILTYGATIRSLTVPDRDGAPVDVVLGYDTLEGYISQDGYLGATVGRFANRIANGRFRLDGHTYTLATNSGRHHLHGGAQGFSHRVWRITDLSDTSLTLSLSSPHGEEGYPGALGCFVRYTLDGDALTIHHHAVTDRTTVCSLTNHSYFNLSGHGSGPVADQSIQICAQYHTPADPENIPLGIIAPVADTPMDLRRPTPIGAHLCDLPMGYDHNYVVDGTMGTLRPAARAYSPVTGITMEVQTTLPGLQFYTGGYLPHGRIGKGGCHYGPGHGFCLETQYHPDSPNQPAFPSPILHAGEAYDHTTVCRFLR